MATGLEGEGHGRGRRLHSALLSLWPLPVPPAALGHPEDVWPCPLARWTPALPPGFHPQPQADFPARPTWGGGRSPAFPSPHAGACRPLPIPHRLCDAHLLVEATCPSRRSNPTYGRNQSWRKGGARTEAWAETGVGVGWGAALVSEPNLHPSSPSTAPFQVSGQATHL